MRGFVLILFFQQTLANKIFNKGPRPKPKTRSGDNFTYYEIDDGLDIFNLTYRLFTNLPSDDTNTTILTTNNIYVTPNVTIEAPSICETRELPNVTINIPSNAPNFTIPKCPSPNITLSACPLQNITLNIPNEKNVENLYSIISMIMSIFGLILGMISLYFTIFLFIQVPANLNNYLAVPKPTEIE